MDVLQQSTGMRFALVTHYRPWTEDDVKRLRGLVASGASAARASVALKRSIAITKNKARDLGIPFRRDAELRKERKKIFQNSTDSHSRPFSKE
jgi:hypothetical protein